MGNVPSNYQEHDLDTEQWGRFWSPFFLSCDDLSAALIFTQNTVGWNL